MDLQTVPQVTPPSVDELVNDMQGQSITDGWDVICAMNAAKVNNLFAQQYVQQVKSNATFFTVVKDTYEIDSQSSVEFINLVLGPPLISFNTGSNEVNLQFNFLCGTVNLLDAHGTILLSQSVSIGDQFQLSGSLPLTTLVGEVNNHDVVLDLTNATDFRANLGISEGTEARLGQYFVQFLQTIIKPSDPNSFNFVLGTLVYSPSGTDLTPVSFDLSTQTSGTGDDGRLLLLIQTTYSSTGGLPNWNPTNFTNIIPDGYSTTLIVSSKVLFSNLLVADITQQFANNQQSIPTFTANQTESNRSYSLTIATKGQDLGQKKFSDGWNGTYYSVNDIVIPGANAELCCNNQYTLQLSLNQQWTDNWYHDWTSTSGPDPAFHHDPENITTTISVNTSFQPTVDSNTCIVSFTPEQQPSPAIKAVDQYGDPDEVLYNQYSPIIGTAITNNFAPFTKIQPSSIDTFAVSNLLFPGDHILNFKDVYIPGDLVIFGDIATSNLSVNPVSAIVAAGQSCNFSAISAGQSVSATWSLNPQHPTSPRGTIDSNGLYTAPKKVSKPEWIQVTATSGGQSSSSILILVPDGVLLSPDVVILSGGATQQFSVSIDGDSSLPVSWTINPGSVGSISSDGTYTAPATVNQPTAVTITATITQGTSSISGSALVVVLGQETTGTLLVAPNSVTLTPSQNQKFTITNSSGNPISEQPSWSILSTLTDPGSIDASGNYTAPSIITNPEVVVVAATLTDSLTDETYVATSLVYLEPSTIN